MSKVIARVTGTAMVPGVSRNGRLYTRELIADAVKRAQPRLDAGNLLLTEETEQTPGEDLHPLTQRTHHAAEDDSTRIVGRLTELFVVPDTGAAKFAADIVDTDDGRTILDLIDNNDGPAFLRGVSIRGAWIGEVSKQLVDGRLVEVGECLELDGLDYTARPGVVGAVVDTVSRLDSGTTTEETATARTPIYETVQEALVGKPVIEEAAATEPAAATRYADPNYHDEPRLPIDTAVQARAAWHRLRTPAVAETYTAAQLKRVRERTQRALKAHGIEPLPNGWLLEREAPTPAAVAESFAYLPDGGLVIDPEPAGSFTARLDNGCVCICISSYSVDPHDLAMIGRAAMEGAAKALELIDPDMDGDADPASEPAESAPEPEPAETTSETPSVTEDAPEPVESHEDPDGEPASAEAISEPSPGTASADAGITDQEGEPGVSEPTSTTPAAQTAPAVTLSAEQFEQLMARVAAAPAAPAAAPTPELVGAGAPVESAPAATVAETAAPEAPVQESDDALVARLVAEQLAKAGIGASVQETREERIQRFVEEGVRAGVQSAAEAGVIGGRKGHVVTAGSGVTESADGSVLPEGVRDVPFHELSEAEWRKIRNAAAAEVAGVQL